MNRSKKLYILLGVLVVVCAAAFGVTRLEEHKERIRTSDEIILELPSDSVQSLSWDHEGTTLAFHKDGGWLYDEDDAFPVDEERINELLGQFRAFGVSFTIEDVEDFGQYGLDDPVCTIKLTAEEQSYQILLGSFSTMDSKRYVSIGDGNVYLVQNDPLDHFDTDLSTMIRNDETPSLDSVTEIQFSGAENYSIIYQEDSGNTYSADDVYFAQQNGENLPLDTSSVNSYLRTISSMSLTNYVTYDATDEELRAYGLDSPELTITVGYTAEDENGDEGQNTFVLHISRDPEEKKAAEEETEDGSDSSAGGTATAYARVDSSPIVYKIFSTEYWQLMSASYDDLRHLEVLWADFSDIRQIDISLEGASYTITSEKDGDDRTYFYQGEELEIDDFQAALEALSADSFTDVRPAQKEEISLTVYLDNENCPEVAIQLYRYDGIHCLAVVDGTPISFIGRSDVVDLIEAVHAIVLK